MKFVPVSPGTSGDSPSHPERPSDKDPYRSIAVRIWDAFVDTRCLLLVASDPLPNSWSIREALDGLEQQLHILEIPCGRKAAAAQIIGNLARFISVEIALVRLRGNAGGPPGRTLIICDNAEQLDGEQLRTLVQLVGRAQGAAAILLLATSDIFLRRGALQNAGIHNTVFVSLPFGHLDGALGLQRDESARTLIPVRDTSSGRLLLDSSSEQPLELAKLEEPEGIPRWVSPAIAAKTITQVGRSAHAKKRWHYVWLALLFCGSFGLGDLILHYTGMTRSGNHSGALTEAPRTEQSNTDAATARRAVLLEPPSVTGSAAAPSVSQHQGIFRHEDSASPPNREMDAAGPLHPENTSSSPQVVAPLDRDGSKLTPSLSPADVAAMLERGEQMVAAGDIASARAYFERAANAGDARAAVRMGETFDPAILTGSGVRGSLADVTQADFWYRRAQLLAKARSAGRPPDLP